MNNYTFGMIGLGVMGRNFLLNVADNGFSALGLDNDPEKAASLEHEGNPEKVKGVTDMQVFVQHLEKPRKIMMLVPAGNPVDAVIGEIIPLLEEGDVLIDGGNSHFTDTDRRYEALAAKGVNYMGIGVSGGEQGARFGPSIMPGGTEEAWQQVQPILEAAAAKVNGSPCVTYLGPRSAGNYVKMVHNGIEYAIMQLISEAYDIMKRGLGMSNTELHETFTRWNEGPLQSFLIEITGDIFAKQDDAGEGDLIDKVLDLAKQKGTGKWTSQHALDLGTPLNAIDVAVSMRYLSARKDERQIAEKLLPYEQPTMQEDTTAVVSQLENALYCSFVTAYAQGYALLQSASEEMGYNFNLSEIARIWRGGCIIRARMLEDFMHAFTKRPHLPNLLTDAHLSNEILERQNDWRGIAQFAILYGIPAAGLVNSLTYYDAYRSSRLPSNLVQAQRDYFGAHTYERTDKEGTFHSQWGQS
jgi:6-phosphogluconate dehydrogenase